MEIFLLLLAVVLGYLIGSLNTSIFLGKLYGVDIRKQGSGNAGATNTVRALGKKAGILVFLGDFLKGLLVCVLAFQVIGEQAVFVGLACVLGHNFPLYFHFKGGKGIATSLGVLAFMDWRVFLIVGILALLLIYITKIVSFSTLSCFVVMPCLLFAFHGISLCFWTGLGMMLLAFFTHRKNIVRLLNGTENKFGKGLQK